MSIVILAFSSVICIFLFFFLERIKDILIGYGQSALERKEKDLNQFYLNRLRDAIFKKDIYGVEEAFLRITLKELLTRKFIPLTGYVKKSFPIFKKHKRYLNGLKILLLVVILFSVIISSYEQIISMDINRIFSWDQKFINLCILLAFSIIIIFAIWYSIFKLAGVEKEEKNISKDLYKEWKYANMFFIDIKKICNKTGLLKKRPRIVSSSSLSITENRNSTFLIRKSKNISVTIIIYVYDTKKYLDECLYSVVNQTKKDIQVICVNNGSKDSLLAVLRKYDCGDEDKFRIINNTHCGAGAARNSTFPYINGKYVLFVDSDDCMELDTCEKVYNKAEETGADLVQFFFHIWDGKKYAGRDLKEYRKYDYHQNQLKLPYSKTNNLQIVHAWNKLWRTSYLINNDLFFDESVRTGEDMLMGWKGIILSKNTAVFPEKLYNHRCIESSLSHSKKTYYTDVIRNYKKIYDFLLENNLYSEYRDFFLSRLIEHYYQYGQRIHKKNLKEYRHEFESILGSDDKAFYSHKMYKKYWFGHL
jgi:glycosyltransferase involved in cell wall biosynthesis